MSHLLCMSVKWPVKLKGGLQINKLSFSTEEKVMLCFGLSQLCVQRMGLLWCISLTGDAAQALCQTSCVEACLVSAAIDAAFSQMLPWDGTVSLRQRLNREEAFPIARCNIYLIAIKSAAFSYPGGISAILFVKLLPAVLTCHSSLSISPVAHHFSASSVCCVVQSCLIMKHREKEICSAPQIFKVPMRAQPCWGSIKCFIISVMLHLCRHHTRPPTAFVFSCTSGKSFAYQQEVWKTSHYTHYTQY